MTVEQEDAVLAWLDAYEEAQNKALEQMKRGR
jgi:hypothetical protein